MLRRDFSNYNVQQLILEVHNIDLISEITNCEDVNDKYNRFHEHLSRVIDKHAPLKEIKPKNDYDLKPWINDNIISMIKTKHILSYKHSKSKNPEHKKSHNILRKKINHEIRRSKYQYFKSFFERNKNNIKRHWDAVNLILHRKKRTITPTSVLKNGKLITHPAEISEIFNKYYVNVAPELVKKLPKKNSHFSEYLKKMDQPLNSFYCSRTTEEEVSKLIQSLDHRKAIDIYNFPIRIIKDLKDEISLPLSNIINSSFNEGVFPDKLKLAKVIPLHKGGDHSIPKNFRPISILPIFDKIIEKLMHKRLTSFLKKHQTFNNSQYGFQKNKSTSMAILDLMEKVSLALTKKFKSCCIFLDLAKAFDTVSHKILLQKLKHYGVRGVTNDWFSSYLSNRKQCVKISNSVSNPLSINCGVPQGSILGPLLFIIYINDILKSSKTFEFVQFADDTCLFIKDKDKKSLTDTTNTELSKISDWLVSNELSLNVAKSNFLYFSLIKADEPPSLKLQGSEIECKEVVKYLGILIDNKLNWSHQTKAVKLKVSRGIGLLHSTKFLIPNSLICNIYFSFIQSHLTYGISAWGSPLTCMSDLIKTSDKAINLVHNLTKSNFLHIDQLYQLECCKLIFNEKHKLLPHNLSKIFDLANQIHQQGTRQAALGGMHIHHLNRFFPIKALSCRFWNIHCLDTFDLEESKSVFINNLKNKLLKPTEGPYIF